MNKTRKVTNLNDLGPWSLRDLTQSQLGQAMERYVETLERCADLNPPLTTEELKYILDACLSGGSIFLRCTFRAPRDD